jgi:hypothetical protein
LHEWLPLLPHRRRAEALGILIGLLAIQRPTCFGCVNKSIIAAASASSSLTGTKRPSCDRRE